MTILQKHLVFIPLFLLVVTGVMSVAVMLLWNWLMPALFGLPALSFWQAAGLLVLCKILFGGIGLDAHHHGHHHGGEHGCANKLRDRWQQMTPEERQRIIKIHQTDDTESAPDGK